MEYLLKPNVHLDEAQKKRSAALATEFRLDSALSDILVARGIETRESARRFLSPEPADLLDPFLFRDMKKAVSLIGNAIAAGGRIWIHGDYDADGTSAAALLRRTLQKMGADVSCYIPSRTAHGYGVAMQTVEEMAGAALLITVDCGITSVAEVARARELGIRTIVTDHHTPPALLPEADALLNPKVEDETYPFRDLCGAGVAFKLAQALIREEALAFLDLAAFGTVADVVPLIGENRTLVALGLEKFNRDPNPGLAALYAPHRDKRGPLTAEGISYQLAPCINAAGRMSSARLALDLMTEDRPGSANIIAVTLARLNADRQARQKQILSEVEDRLAALKEVPDFIVLHDPSWEPGLVGVAANSVCERFGRPALLLGRQGETFVGSARSPRDLNVYDALQSVAALLVRFGGHAGAAGLTMEEENIPELSSVLNAYAAGCRSEEGRPEAEYDLAPALPVSTDLVRSLEVLEPCGFGNPRPRILLRNVEIADVRPLSGGEHSAFGIRGRGGRLDAVRFRTPPGEVPARADVVGTLGINSFRGSDSPQMIVEVFSVAEADDAIFEELARHVCQVGRPEDAWRYRRGKQRLGLIYSALKKITERGPLGWRRLYQGMLRLVPGLEREEFVYAVCVFTELKLLAGTKDGRIRVIASAPKRSLEESSIFRKFEEFSHGSESEDSQH